jgi:hypothetical protein
MKMMEVPNRIDVDANESLGIFEKTMLKNLDGYVKNVIVVFNSAPKHIFESN